MLRKSIVLFLSILMINSIFLGIVSKDNGIKMKIEVVDETEKGASEEKKEIEGKNIEYTFQDNDSFVINLHYLESFKENNYYILHHNSNMVLPTHYTPPEV